MIMTLFEYPLPNNGERYDLSQDELSDLLYKAYRNGFNHAKEVYHDADKIKTTSYPADILYKTIKMENNDTYSGNANTFVSDWR